MGAFPGNSKSLLLDTCYISHMSISGTHASKRKSKTVKVICQEEEIREVEHSTICYRRRLTMPIQSIKWNNRRDLVRNLFYAGHLFRSGSYTVVFLNSIQCHKICFTWILFQNLPHNLLASEAHNWSGSKKPRRVFCFCKFSSPNFSPSALPVLELDCNRSVQLIAHILITKTAID